MNRATRLREDIARLCGRAQAPNAFLHQVSRRIRLAVPFEASSWSTTDPETLLVTGGLVENLPTEACRTYFDNELLVPDVNKYRDLARRRPSVGILTQATAGVPERSARYRELVQPLGFRGELRLAFVADGDCWGIACLFRRAGDFHPREAALLGRLCGPLASGLRTSIRAGEGGGGGGVPGTVVLDEHGRVEALTPEAQRWFAELSGLTERTPVPASPPVPPSVYVVAARSRALADGKDSVGPPRARVRTRSGGWLILHASQLIDPARGPNRTAVVLEPARPAELAPLLAKAYDLSSRELELVQLLARGLGTGEIARTLWISPHTVRGHLKAIFSKLDVSSRSELMVRLFADHYHDRLVDNTLRVDD